MKERIAVRDRRIRGSKAIVWAACGLMMGLMAYFAWTTVYSSDDYWYSTFWDNGFAAYLELMDYHYREFNGRVLVHVLAHIVLHLGQWSFVLMCCGLCAAACAAGCRGAGLGRDKLPGFMALFLTGMLCMPLQIFNQGVMWISASCNYLFPAVLTCLMAAALERRSRWCYLLAFLCGATTEQMGLAAAALAAVCLIDAVIRREKPVYAVGSLVFAMVGVASIFASPATARRADNRVHMDSLAQIMDTFCKAIEKEAELLTRNPAPVIVMLSILVLGCILLRRSTGRKWIAAMAGIGAAALVVGSIGSGMVCVGGYVLGFLALAGMAVALMVCGERFAGTLIFAGLASAAVMLPTNTVEPRVMLPVYLLLLVSGCVLCMRLLRDAAIPAAAGLILSVVVSIPAIGGYWHNYVIDQRNLDYVEQDRDRGEIRYCTDYDMDYTWVKADFDPYFRMMYMESVGLPQTTPVRFFSSGDAPLQICYGDHILIHLPFRAENGTILFPLRETVEILGGVLEWTPEQMTITIDGRTLELVGVESGYAAQLKDADGNAAEFRGEWLLLNGERYCDRMLFEQAFGVIIREDLENNQYIIEKQ